jgi:hypothetical protein
MTTENQGVPKQQGAAAVACTDLLGRPLLLMQALRADGWCMVLKCRPKEMGWIIEGSRSEYDAPSPDTTIGNGKWCCEAQFMGEPYKPNEWAMHEDPSEAVQRVWDAIHNRPNARPEWRGAEGVEMQTGRAIPRPLQADS